MAAITRVLLLALVLFASGCDKEPPHYQGIDVTGTDWGRDFELHDPDGKIRRLADFRGKYVMLFFGYTSCPDVCPTALSRAVAVRKLLGKDGERVQVIFVTVDPERDKPELLREYTTAFDPDFLALYGDSAETSKVTKEFRVFFEHVPTGNSYTVNHTSLTYVFDPAGKLRLVEQHTLGADALAADIRGLMRDSR